MRKADLDDRTISRSRKNHKASLKDILYIVTQHSLQPATKSLFLTPKVLDGICLKLDPKHKKMAYS